MKSATLIYNPVAGRHPVRRERQIRAAAEELRRAGTEVTLAATTRPGDARDLARAATDDGAQLVLVCGGDGTVNEVINGLVPGGATLGILPGGTANIIGKELRLPHHPIHAARALPGWKPRRIALGRAAWRDAASHQPTQRLFISVAGVGLDAYIIRRLSWSLKMSWGVVGYALEAVRQALRYSYPRFRFTGDGRDRQATFAVIHRTGHYAGWLPLAPTASLFKPDFTACLFTSTNRARYFFYAAAVLLRQHRRLRDVELVDCSKVDCAGEEPGKPIHFELDGELVGELPATFEIVPDALTILVP
ncbi:MAG: diacylglycerol kinase family lipid kinase [Acidobacteriia bacterium]|nr:diacylglycerol kinase family lipid kinase [Terriglobia bacterium]